jgi:hypothetical protein
MHQSAAQRLDTSPTAAVNAASPHGAATAGKRTQRRAWLAARATASWGSVGSSQRRPRKSQTPAELVCVQRLLSSFHEDGIVSDSIHMHFKEQTVLMYILSAEMEPFFRQIWIQ